MKCDLASFPLFIGLMFFCFFGQNAPVTHTVQEADSLALYYKKSKNRKLTKDERIASIDNAIRIAKANTIDSSYLQILAYKSKLYGQYKQYDQAIEQSILLEKEASKIRNMAFVALAYNKLGYYEGKKNKVVANYGWYKKSFELYKKIKDSLNVVIMAKRLGNLLHKQGAYIDAEQVVVEALPYGTTLKDPSELSWLYDILALGKRNQGQYEEAIAYHKQAIEYETSPISIPSLKNNLGVTYIKSGNYAGAVTVYKDLLESEVELSKSTQVRFLDNYAHAKSKLKDPEGETLLLKALARRVEIQDYYGQIASHLHLADFYKNKDNQTKWEYHAHKGLEIANQLQSPEGRLEALEYLIPFKPSLFEEYIILKDSIITVNANNRNSFAKIRYDYTEAERLKDNAVLESQKSGLKTQRAILGLLILGLVSSIVFYYQRKNARNQKNLERYATEARISKKVHDELANDIFGLRSELELAQLPEGILHKVDLIYDRTRNISSEHKSIDTGIHFFEALSFMLRATLSQEIKLILRGSENIHWPKVSKNTKVALYRSLQELMVNAKKHSNAGMIVVAFAKANKKTLQVEYRDNGTGSTIKKSTGSGLQNVETRISDLNGTFTFEVNKDTGCVATIIIPV